MRGAREFLRTSRSILARPRTALWITAQGRFADARERPPGIQPGVAHLAHRLDQAVILPLALEYPFWEERRPEALARFGQAIVVERGADRTVEEWRTCIEAALTSTQDALVREAQRRDPAAFQTLVGGKARRCRPSTIGRGGCGHVSGRSFPRRASVPAEFVVAPRVPS